MTPELPPAPQTSLPPTGAERRREQLRTAGIVLASVVAVALIGLALYWMGAHPGPTQTIRDIFIILAALVLLFILLALAVLIVQLARLTNLLQHEIKPILDSTNETVSTLRGTIAFLSDHLTGPVVTLNSYVAGLQRLLDLLKIKI